MPASHQLTYKTCKRCGRDFRVKPSHYDKKTYCGRECMRQDYRERMAGSDNPNFRNAGVRTCAQCNATFHSYNKHALFCSGPCAKQSDSFRDKQSQAKREQWLRQPWSMAKLRDARVPVVRQPKPPKLPRKSCRVERACSICSTVFSCWRTENKFTCSDACRRARISRQQKGERSHRWRGGLTAEATLVRTSAAYAEWRSAVYVRDDYTCCLCEVRGGRLTAHHIKLFSTHAELRLVVTNGITICWPCHATIRTREHEYEEQFTAIVAAKLGAPL